MRGGGRSEGTAALAEISPNPGTDASDGSAAIPLTLLAWRRPGAANFVGGASVPAMTLGIPSAPRRCAPVVATGVDDVEDDDAEDDVWSLEEPVGALRGGGRALCGATERAAVVTWGPPDDFDRAYRLQAGFLHPIGRTMS